ncbi:hypothetical protein DICVIV_07229 [Dictyocaulus viviparus]|uniref:Uncharacterized protein n=1 Tax=Dictyocaulus viviparus TaxID=29172 RepID=A0A0D8XQB4_DICVI|nr:hypothetical protein DICVIV_07229 [Dictyocaulus viviparus]
MQCEGSCGGFHNCRKLTIESKSGRKICQSCCRQAEGLYDIRPMKTDDTLSFSAMSTNNNRYEEFRPEATTSATARETEKNLAHNYIVPTELLQIRVVILEKAHHIIVRRKLEIELPSDFLIKHILDVIEDCMFVIFSFEKKQTKNKFSWCFWWLWIEVPRNIKQQLLTSVERENPLKISAEQKTRLKSIANGRSLINFIVATKGVCVLKSDLNKRETKPVMTSSVR